MANRLARESSPYLKQHQDNPVDWYPWGEEALTKAREENKPILLSVGYSACHWCHVMAHESFENPDIAGLMNERYVNIKVDREERPDLDQIYQNVAQAMTQSGGWPLTVFLTPDLKPFFGGTYYPPEDRWGRPGFPRVLQALSDAYTNDPKAVTENAEKLTEFIQELEKGSKSEMSEMPTRAKLDAAAELLLSQVDWQAGGIGGAPKFPNSMMLDFLWRLGLATDNDAAMQAALLTLTKMASGGIYDQLGGGFHRYSVDETWSVPHFEKMLYDNGLLLRSYAQVLLSAGSLPVPLRRLFTRVLKETVLYLLREMRSAEGLFYAAQDADSEGEEGKFFVWDRNDLASELSEEEAGAFAAHFGVSQEGNFEHGKTVLFLPKGEDSEESEVIRRAKSRLFDLRSRRIAPGTDDKILASWNGLVISGLAWASQALRSEGDVKTAELAWDAANLAFDSMVSKMSAGDARLMSTYKEGRARLNAYLDDYAFSSLAALDLSRFETDAARVKSLVAQAERWIGTVLEHFKDDSGMGYFFTSDDHEKLIQRPKSLHDQAIPSGVAVVLQCLMALAELDFSGKRGRYLSEVTEQLSQITPVMTKRPYGFGELMNAALLWLTGPLTISGKDAVRAVTHPFVFHKPGDHAQLCHRETCEALAGNPQEVLRGKIRLS